MKKAYNTPRMKRNAIPEYDLHPAGASTEDALAILERIVASARRGNARVFVLITGYGSSGGTAKIKSAVLAKCRKYLAQRHIRGFLDGEFAGDMFSQQYMAFPAAAEIPVSYKRSPNPGIVFVCV